MVIKSIGERICYCRSILNLSQREFAELFKISKPTINRWENNAVKVSTKQLSLLIDKFKQYGIIVDIEWLINGNGISPINLNASEINQLNFDEIAYSTLNNLKSEIKNFEIYQINTNFFAPVINYADYVAGIVSINRKSLLGKLCFAINDGYVSVGVYDYLDNTLLNFTGEKLLLRSNDYEIGEVLWTAKRF